MDFISTFPFDTIVTLILEEKGHIGGVKLIGIVKLTRMLRLRKIVAFMNV